jgi:hypothetical protein
MFDFITYKHKILLKLRIHWYALKAMELRGLSNYVMHDPRLYRKSLRIKSDCRKDLF